MWPWAPVALALSQSVRFCQTVVDGDLATAVLAWRCCLRRALFFVPFILACGGLDSSETGDGSPIDEATPPPSAPLLSIDRSIVNLGALDVGVSGIATVTLTNTGNAASGAVTITASAGVTATGCDSPLVAGASCPISITATPTSMSAFSGTVSISANPGAVTPLQVTVIAMSIGDPLLSVSPAIVDLGPIPVGFAVPPTKITLDTGTGLTDLTLAASGPDVSIDQVNTTCTTVLAPGASCVVIVNFLATAVGNKSDGVVIASGGPAGKVVTVSITANVVTGVFLVINPSTPQGGAALVGQTSSPFTITVGNQGDTSTGDLSVAVTGPNAVDFVTTSSCGVLAPLATCAVSVLFYPVTNSDTMETATLTVTDPGSVASTVAVSLIGIVVPPP